MVDPSRVGNSSVKPRSNLGQPWSTLVKLGQTSPNSGKCILGHVSRVFGHSGPLVLRADTLENPGGKNGVMTVRVSKLFMHILLG